jgi:hypothetical protein
MNSQDFTKLHKHSLDKFGLGRCQEAWEISKKSGTPQLVAEKLNCTVREAREMISVGMDHEIAGMNLDEFIEKTNHYFDCQNIGCGGRMEPSGTPSVFTCDTCKKSSKVNVPKSTLDELSK